MRHIHKWSKVEGTEVRHGEKKKDPLGNWYITDGGCGNVESYYAECVTEGPCNVDTKKVTIQCCNFTPSKHA